MKIECREYEEKKYPLGTKLKIDAAGYQSKTFTVAKISDDGFTMDAGDRVLYWFNWGCLSHYESLGNKGKVKIIKEKEND